jgi:AdoMet-dependent heme synthase
MKLGEPRGSFHKMALITSYQTLRNKAAKKLIPLHCLFELTYNCNLKCVHCYIVRNGKREMGKWKVFNILEQLKEAGCLYLTLSGGEIFVRKDFFEIANYARKLNFALKLFTNGTLITADTADKIRDLKLISVEISLQGFKDTHEEITKVKGSFDKTVRAIELLRERDVKVFVRATLMRQNADEIWKLQEFVNEKLKARWRGIGGGILLSPCDDGNRRPLNYRLDDKQLRKYIKEEFKQFKSLGQDYKPRKVNKNESLCRTGFVSCNITPYGELNPCVQIRLRNNTLLRNKSLMEIWRGHEEIKRLRSLRMIDRKDCLGCEYISYCFVCLGITLIECGSLLAKLPEACRQARIRKEVYEEIFKNRRRSNENPRD